MSRVTCVRENSDIIASFSFELTKIPFQLLRNRTLLLLLSTTLGKSWINPGGFHCYTPSKYKWRLLFIHFRFYSNRLITVFVPGKRALSSIFVVAGLLVVERQRLANFPLIKAASTHTPLVSMTVQSYSCIWFKI